MGYTRIWSACRAAVLGAGLLGSFGAAFGAGQREVVLYSTRADNTMHVLDAGDLSLIASHPIGLGAHELIVSPDGRWAVGTAYGGPGPGHQPADNRLAVFDLRKGELHRTVELAGLKRPNDGAFTADSEHVYVTVEQPAQIVKVEVETGAFKAIELEHGTNHMLALSPDGSRLFVAHVMPGAVSVIDTATEKVMARHRVPDGAEGVAVSRDGKSVWVSCNRSDKVVVLDAGTGEVRKEFATPGFPFRLRVSPDGRTVAVTCPKTDEVVFFDAAAALAGGEEGAGVRRVSLRDGAAAGGALVPTSVAFTATGAHVAVVCSGPGAGVVLVEVSSGKVTARRPADGGAADAVATARAGA